MVGASDHRESPSGTSPLPYLIALVTAVIGEAERVRRAELGHSKQPKRSKPGANKVDQLSGGENATRQAVHRVTFYERMGGKLGGED